MKRVILETPYKGKDWEDTEENLRFARLCGRDCIKRGEAYFASHLLYTQEGVLDDKVAEERTLGINAGFAWKEIADKTVIYINRDISKGMHLGVRKTIELGQAFEYRNLPSYDKAPMPQIITVSGSTGSGKTTTAGRVLELNPSARMLTSYTTRGSRPDGSDLPGEYKYNVPLEYFERHKDDFLWTAIAHGNTYGTTRESVANALTTPGPWLMILVPQVLKKLQVAVANLIGHIYGSSTPIDVSVNDKVTSFYILAPEYDELIRRLTQRIDDSETIRKRIEDAKRAKEYDALALQSDILYIFLRNDEPDIGPALAAQQISVFL